MKAWLVIFYGSSYEKLRTCTRHLHKEQVWSLFVGPLYQSIIFVFIDVQVYIFQRYQNSFISKCCLLQYIFRVVNDV